MCFDTAIAALPCGVKHATRANFNLGRLLDNAAFEEFKLERAMTNAIITKSKLVIDTIIYTSMSPWQRSSRKSAANADVNIGPLLGNAAIEVQHRSCHE